MKVRMGSNCANSTHAAVVIGVKVREHQVVDLRRCRRRAPRRECAARSRACAGGPGFDSNVPSPGKPASMRSDSPAGVTMSVACPPSTSMK